MRLWFDRQIDLKRTESHVPGLALDTYGSPLPCSLPVTITADKVFFSHLLVPYLSSFGSNRFFPSSSFFSLATALLEAKSASQQLTDAFTFPTSCQRRKTN